MGERIPQSVAYLVIFKAYSSTDHVTEATGKTIAITISKNGATSFSNPAAGATNATEMASGWYKVSLGTGDTDTVGPLAIRGAVATIDDVGIALTVVKATNHGFSALPDTAVTTNASLITSGTGTDQLSLTSGKVAEVVLADTVTTYTGNTVQTGDAYARLGAPAGASHAADVAAVKVDTAAIKVQTDKLTFTVSQKLDVNVYTWNGTAVATPATAGIPDVNVKNAANTAWGSGAITAASIAADAITAAKVADGTIDAATFATGAITASAIAADAITDAKVASDVTIASVTGAVGSVTGAVGSVTGITASDVGAIKAKTDNLPAAPASTTNITAGTITTVTNLTNAPTAGDLTSTMKTSVTTAATAATPIAASVTGAVGSVTGLTASDVGAIKAKTDNLPAAPADESLVIAATNAIYGRIGAPAGASVSADIAAVKSDSGAVKTQTDKLTFSVANELDANIHSVNDVTVNGDGAGTPWGP